MKVSVGVFLGCHLGIYARFRDVFSFMVSFFFICFFALHLFTAVGQKKVPSGFAGFLVWFREDVSKGFFELDFCLGCHLGILWNVID